MAKIGKFSLFPPFMQVWEQGSGWGDWGEGGASNYPNKHAFPLNE